MTGATSHCMCWEIGGSLVQENQENDNACDCNKFKLDNLNQIYNINYDENLISHMDMNFLIRFANSSLSDKNMF